MSYIEIPLNLKSFDRKSADRLILDEVSKSRLTASQLIKEERYMDALERIVDAMRSMKNFSDYENIEFRALLCGLLFDLAEINFALKDYKQSERELETLFKVLDRLIKVDTERFGPFHILAMELSTRILRNRKKTVELLTRQQIVTNTLYEKVNAGMHEATEKLVDSLCRTATLLAATGSYREALKFFAEAIRWSKRRNGRVTRKEIKITVDMAVVMIRVKSLRPRAARLLRAVLPQAIELAAVELEEDILALLEVIGMQKAHDSRWRAIIGRIGIGSKTGKHEAKPKK